MEIKYVGTIDNEADICTKNLDGANHERIREFLRCGTMRIWTDYDKVIASMPQREDVKKRDRVTSIVIRCIDDDDDDSNEDTEERVFCKRMKILW